MELENRNSQLQEELSAAPARRAGGAQADWLPRAPARHVLTGHRSPVTRVTFHPVFSVIVSASDDASIKVWDWETGELERTLKGHTKAVKDVDFDSKGLLLGAWPMYICSQRMCRDGCHSELLVRSYHPVVGHQQQLCSHQDALWTRSRRLVGQISAGRRISRQRES